VGPGRGLRGVGGGGGGAGAGAAGNGWRRGRGWTLIGGPSREPTEEDGCQRSAERGFRFARMGGAEHGRGADARPRPDAHGPAPLRRPGEGAAGSAGSFPGLHGGRSFASRFSVS
jgi:hypothetical protein